MIAILIHFLGHLVVNSAVPPYVESADAYFLALWYAAFAAVDLIAASVATGTARTLLTISFAWSCALVVEQLFMLDTLQRYDWVAQYAIDGALFALLAFILVRATRANNPERQRP